MIIAGKYEGNYFVLNGQKISFISKDPAKLNADTFVSTMYKDDIKSITKESEHASGNKERVAFWLGSIAAAGVSETKVYVIRIVWQDGQESLANITDSQYQYVLATQIKPAPTFKNDPSFMAPSIKGQRFTFVEPYADNSKRTISVLFTDSEMRVQYSCDKSFIFDPEFHMIANHTETFPYSDIKKVEYKKNEYNIILRIASKSGKEFYISGNDNYNTVNLPKIAKLVEEKAKRHNPQFHAEITETKVENKVTIGMLLIGIFGILLSVLLFIIPGIPIFLPIACIPFSLLILTLSVFAIINTKKTKKNEKSK
jgi:hypothetical protein